MLNKKGKNKMKKDSILNSNEWFEFENNFEEGWTDDAEVPTLANYEHHIAVAEAAAEQLAKTFKNQDEITDPSIINAMYAYKAHQMFPNDHVWYGDFEGTRGYWYEHIKNSKNPEKEMRFWHEEEYGSFEEYGKTYNYWYKHCI